MRRLPAVLAVATAAALAAAPAAPAAPIDPGSPVVTIPPAAAVAPGVGAGMYDVSGHNEGACTLGFLADGADGTRYAFTAGHCASTGDVVMPYKTAGNYLQVGQFADAVMEDGADSPDIAVIRLEAGTPQDARVLSGRPVGGVTTHLAPSDTLCFYGVVSGLRCGPVAASLLPGAATVEFGAVSQDGDSGAPVYRIENDGSATAVGILTGGVDGDSATTATLIEPYLEKWNLALAR